MAKEIKEMISQEIAKAQAAALWIQDVEGTFDTSKCLDNLRVKFTANLLRGRAKEWWNYILAAKDPDVAQNMPWNEFKELFLQKFSPQAELKNIRRNFLSTHQATQQSVHEFSMTFLDRSCFLPEYINDQKLLMNHYVEMLRKEIPLEQEQETKKRERSPLKRRIEQGGSSSKKYKSNKTYPRFGEKDTHSVPIVENSIRTTTSPRQQKPRGNTNRRRAPPAPKPSGAYNLVGFQRPQRPPSHVYQMMTTEEAKEEHDVVTGTFFVNLLHARVLFDSGSDRSFVSESFSQNFIIPTNKLNPSLDVEVAGNKIIHVVSVFQNCEIEIDNEKFPVDLIPMPMGEINVVIGVDWLSKNEAIISCQNKLIRVKTLSGGETFIYGERKKTSLAIYMYARAKRHLARRCQAYLAYVVDIQKNIPKFDSIPIVREFPDVFPEELLRIPPDKQVEFRIDLILGSTHVAKTPYRLAPSEMQELMK
ncbi:reverse transcriptase domain-containing protein [Tanacetum coccineum]|uniref:Reverse transcriptase domain-containing protein n=1 Tax=Tanacetum coccineum TaxID=301880 RepID=A0ABQ5GJX8_9ASTR